MYSVTFPVGPLACNCSIVGCPETKEAVVIDPGGDVDAIMAIVEEQGFKVKYLLHTHAHFDHVLGARELKDRTGAKIALHKEDQWLYDGLLMQPVLLGMSYGFKSGQPHPVDHYLQDEEEIPVGNLKTRVIFTPGHTPGSCCFSLEEKESILFSGDTLFQHSIGRTDFPGGSFDKIVSSIQGRLFKLDDSTEVIPGHGPTTTIWSEKRENPYVSI